MAQDVLPSPSIRPTGHAGDFVAPATDDVVKEARAVLERMGFAAPAMPAPGTTEELRRMLAAAARRDLANAAPAAVGAVLETPAKPGETPSRGHATPKLEAQDWTGLPTTLREAGIDFVQNDGGYGTLLLAGDVLLEKKTLKSGRIQIAVRRRRLPTEESAHDGDVETFAPFCFYTGFLLPALAERRLPKTGLLRRDDDLTFIDDYLLESPAHVEKFVTAYFLATTRYRTSGAYGR
jgi:hypothetical protein